MDINEYVTTPDALFHYTKTSIAIEHILYKKKLRLSILNDSNDPREYKFKIFNSHRSSPTIGALDDALYDNALKDARTEINRILRFKCRVMCFCSNVKPALILSDGHSKEDEYFYSEGWDKSRMWSQYGENHCGICLILSKSEIEKVLDERKAQVKKCEANYVKYLQKGITYPSFNGSLLGRKNVEECASQYVMDNFEELFFRKHFDYRDEAEFRVVVFDPCEKLEYLDISTSLKGVIVGDRTHDVYTHLINQACKDLNIECRQAHWSISNPQMLLCKCKSPDST